MVVLSDSTFETEVQLCLVLLLILCEIPGIKHVDHKCAVKIYERAAGDKTLPSDLRPPPVLKVSHQHGQPILALNHYSSREHWTIFFTS